MVPANALPGAGFGWLVPPGGIPAAPVWEIHLIYFVGFVVMTALPDGELDFSVVTSLPPSASKS